MPAAWAYDALMVVIGAAIQLFAVSAIVYVQKTRLTHSAVTRSARTTRDSWGSSRRARSS